MRSAASSSSCSRSPRVDLVEREQRRGSRALASLSRMRLDLLVDALARRRPAARRCRHRARRPRRHRPWPVEPPLGREDAGRVDEHDLARACDGDAAHGRRASSAPCAMTIETLAPTSALISVDLPALGAPMMATKPQRGRSAARRGVIARGHSCAFGLQHALALEQRRAPPPARPPASRRPRRAPAPSLDAHFEVKRGAWSGPLRLDLDIARQRRPWPCAHSCSAVLASARGRVGCWSIRRAQVRRPAPRAGSKPASR